MSDGSPAASLEAYLHAHIPISLRLGVRVAAAESDRVTLTAPLEPNLNHRSTVFGGSASALALLAAWSLIHLRLPEGTGGVGIVIQRNRVEYLRPMRAEFSATAVAPPAEEWSRCLRALARRGRGRVSVRAELRCAGELAGRFEGEYVVLQTAPGQAPAGGA